MSDGPVRPWRGEPVYFVPSHCNDDRNTWRVFHRDIPGRVVAEFYGDAAREGAMQFCEMFGERCGFREKETDK